jgi:hypothetical protein
MTSLFYWNNQTTFLFALLIRSLTHYYFKHFVNWYLKICYQNINLTVITTVGLCFIEHFWGSLCQCSVHNLCFGTNKSLLIRDVSLLKSIIFNHSEQSLNHNCQSNVMFVWLRLKAQLIVILLCPQVSITYRVYFD